MFALSPELGDDHRASQHFFIEKFEEIKNVIEENFQMVYYVIGKLKSRLSLTLVQVDAPQYTFDVQNTGL